MTTNRGGRDEEGRAVEFCKVFKRKCSIKKGKKGTRNARQRNF